MTTNEVKKALYKQNPIAKKTATDGYYYHYLAYIKGGDSVLGNPIAFQVPIQDMGMTVFGEEMEAKHLIRWMRDF